MNDPKQILVEREGHVARVTINRPERRNAVSFAAWQSLAAAFENLAVDPEARVVVLTGAGDRAFCAGNDISEFAEKRSTPEQVAAYDGVIEHAYEVIGNLEKPLIARVRGSAVGGGFELVQLCDLRIAGAGARFAMTPARLGLGYTLRDVQLLVDRIGAGAGARDALHRAAVRCGRGGTAGVREPGSAGRGARRGGGRLRRGDRGQRSALDPGHQGGDRGGAQAPGGS